MVIVLIQIKFNNGVLGKASHYVPMEQYHNYYSKMNYHKNKINFIKELPKHDLSMLDELTTAESEFKDFLINIEKEVEGCYDLFIVDETDVDYTIHT